MSKAIDLENGLPAIKTWVEGKLAEKAPLASPALTGTPTAPTADTSDNSTKIATTAYVKAVMTAGTIDVDEEMSSTSINPVQNKVITAALADKVDAVDGKGLSTNDYTTAEKNKLTGIEAGAEENVIESVQVNGTALAVSSKTVNVPKATNSVYGAIILSDSTSGTATAASGGTAATPKAVADALAAATGAIPSAADASPIMDGTATVGSSTDYAREDHVHPTDTSRAPVSHATTATTYGAGNGTNYGHVKLSDATDGTSAASSGGTAATPKAVADALAAAKTYADGKVSGVYNYRGSVATYANLPAAPETGDVYNVEAAYQDYPAGTNWAYTGSAWDALGGSFTITYATAAEVTAVLNAS